MNPSLYIHIPFCRSKCSYCSFISFEDKKDLINPYLEALQKEATGYKGTAVDTVYIGGGTPSYLDIRQLESLFEIIRSNFYFSSETEVTIETNPATFDLEKAEVLRDNGINRVSLGIQSLDDKFLNFLGRPYSRTDALSAFEILKQANFKNINLDLIYALPQQDEQEIKKDVAELLSLESEHISLYTLTIDPGSAFFKKGVVSVSQDTQARHYELVIAMLKEKGFRHYEVSNFSKEGHECRHNLNYWNAGRYIGLGVAAHSHLNGSRFWNTQGLQSYITKIQHSGSAKAGEEKLPAPQQLMEAFLIGLRLTQGVDLTDLETRYQTKLSSQKESDILAFIQRGFLKKDNDRIKATPEGMMVLDELCSRLI